jgi:hypothetical protein
MKRLLSAGLLALALLAGCYQKDRNANDLSEVAVEKAPEIRGKITGPEDVSGIAFVGDYLVLCSDEANCVAVLKKDGHAWVVRHEIELDAKGKNLDLEAVAAEGKTVYVTGSHNRFRTEGGKGKVVHDPARDKVFRFTLDKEGKAGKIETMSLRKAIDGDPVLSPFVPISSKENGIDIEGLAVKGGWLYFGFRGPVLKDDWVPILRCQFGDAPEKTASLRYVKLGGMGVRDMTATKDGFLILAGPVYNKGKFQLYFWDGEDCKAGGKVRHLTDLEVSGKAKAEGLAVLSEDEKGYDVLIVHDGITNGGPVRKRVEK